MTDALQFPKPEPTDTEDVVWALEAASSMWERGDGREAVRWIRRAAESAGDAGNDLRALALARVAADLAQAANIPPSIPPPAPMEPKSNPQAPIPPMDDSDGPSATDYTIPDGMPAVQPPEPEPPPPPPSSPVAAGSSPSASPHAWRPRQAIRVAVEPSPDDRNLLLVRPLAEGETAPEHAHEAMLTAMEAGAHLLSRKR